MKKKLFILENKPNKCLNKTIFKQMRSTCQQYSDSHNLELLIWDDVFCNSNSLYNQLYISSNAEIIVGFGGSMWLYNFAMTKGNILLLNGVSEILGNKIVDNMTFYTQHLFAQENPNINKYIYYNNPADDYCLLDVVNSFLYSYIKK